MGCGASTQKNGLVVAGGAASPDMAPELKKDISSAEKPKDTAVEDMPTREPSEEGASPTEEVTQPSKKEAPTKTETPTTHPGTGECGDEGDLEAWGEGLGADGQAAALKMQSAQRGKAARADVEKLKLAKKETDKVSAPEVEPAPTAATTEEPAPAAVPEPAPAAEPVVAEGNTLQAWGEELGSDGAAAAVKMQAVQRGKADRAKIEKLKQEKQNQGGENETAAATGKAPVDVEQPKNDNDLVAEDVI